MKKVFFVCAMVSIALFSSCAKEEIDERDKFIGTWKGTNTIVVNSLDFNESTTEQFTIQKKSGTTNQIEFIYPEEDNAPKIVATVNGNSYTYDEFLVTENQDNTTITLVINGGGQINGSVISETGTITMNVMGESYSGIWNSTMNKQ